jgi:hypothetical protein
MRNCVVDLLFDLMRCLFVVWVQQVAATIGLGAMADQQSKRRLKKVAERSND